MACLGLDGRGLSPVWELILSSGPSLTLRDGIGRSGRGETPALALLGLGARAESAARVPLQKPVYCVVKVRPV